MKIDLDVDFSAERQKVHKALGWITFQVRWYSGIAAHWLSRRLNRLSIWLLARPSSEALASNVRETFDIDLDREMESLGKLFLDRDTARIAWLKSKNRHGWVLKEDD